MHDDMDEVFETKIHFHLPVFFNEYKKYTGYKEKLSIYRINSVISLSISYKMSDGRKKNKYHTEIIEWHPPSLMTSTVSEYNIFKEMQRRSPIIEDYNHINNNSELKDLFIKGN